MARLTKGEAIVPQPAVGLVQLMSLIVRWWTRSPTPTDRPR